MTTRRTSLRPRAWLAVLLGLQLVAWPATATAHPFFVTICQIDHNPETLALEITFRFFTDDLERGLEDHAGTRLFLGTDRESEATDRHLIDYLTSQVDIATDAGPARLRYVGKEVELDLTYCYVEVPDVPVPSRVSITNRILLEQFESQTNIVHVTVGGTQKSLLLRSGHVSDAVEF